MSVGPEYVTDFGDTIRAEIEKIYDEAPVAVYERRKN